MATRPTLPVCVFQTITIVKAGGPLGLSIVGGIDHTSHPFGIDEPGIFISKVGHFITVPSYKFAIKAELLITLRLVFLYWE